MDNWIIGVWVYTNRLALLWANVVERLSESLNVYGAWGKLFCTKFPYSSASGELDRWIIGVWIYADELASYGHITNKDRVALATFAFAKCQELKARKEITNLPAERNVGKWRNGELERNGSHRSLLR